jgi:hypothetical protein
MPQGAEGPGQGTMLQPMTALKKLVRRRGPLRSSALTAHSTTGSTNAGPEGRHGAHSHAICFEGFGQECEGRPFGHPVSHIVYRESPCEIRKHECMTHHGLLTLMLTT